MRSLEITAANLDNQRNAVQEERRLGVDNQPYGKTFEVRDELAYENFAYEHSVIGSMADLERRDGRRRGVVLQDLLRPEQRRAQHRRRRRREGDDREGAEVLRVDSVAAGAADGRHDRAGAEGRAADDARGRPGAADAHRHGLQDAAELARRLRRAAGAGDRARRTAAASRFFESIVRDKQLATGVSAFAGESRGPGLFTSSATRDAGQGGRRSRGGDRRRDRAGQDRRRFRPGRWRRRATARAASW